MDENDDGACRFGVFDFHVAGTPDGANDPASELPPEEERIEAVNAAELVRRLSVYRPPTVRLQPSQQGQTEYSPSGAANSEPRGSATLRSPGTSPGNAGVPQLLLRLEKSVTFGAMSAGDDTDVESLQQTVSAAAFTLAHCETTERFGPEALEELGRAANDFEFEDWLALGQQITLRDRFDSSANALPGTQQSFGHGTDFLAAHTLEYNSRRAGRQIIGSGFGEEAVRSIDCGIFDPSTVLPSLIEGFWNSVDEETYDDALQIAIEPPKNADLNSDENAAAATVEENGTHGHNTDFGSTGLLTAQAPGSQRADDERRTSKFTEESSFLGATLTSSTTRLGATLGDSVEERSPAAGEKRRSVRTKSIALLEDFFSSFRDPDQFPGAPAGEHQRPSGEVPPSSTMRSHSHAGSDERNTSIVSHDSSGGGSNRGVHAHEVVQRKLCDYRPEISHGIARTVEKMGESLRPFTFQDFLAACREALAILKVGDPTCEVHLPIMLPADPPLVGAEAVMKFVKRRIFEAAQEFGGTVYAAEWVFRYTVAFVNTRIARDEGDALCREEILSECVQQLADIAEFTTLVLALGSKARHYEEFQQLQQWMEAQAESLIAPLESKLQHILTQCPFPDQRRVLRHNAKQLERMSTTALQFLVAFDKQWSSTIPYHAAWKTDFMNRCYRRMHGNVANAWMTASMGFVDPILPALVRDDGSVGPSADLRRKIPMAVIVERLRCTENVGFYDIALHTKGLSSSVVGFQLCMGARYVLDESAPEYDDKWGFHMCDGIRRQLQDGTVEVDAQ